MDEKLQEALLGLMHIYAVDLFAFDEEFLIKSLARASVAAGIQNPVQYCEHLKENPKAADLYFKSLHITFTQFFREPLLFAFLEHTFIPNLVRQASEGREIRVWSAGCSSGQEAYSLAILLDEQLKTIEKKLRFRIFATDISKEALAVAEKGEYQTSDLQNVRLKHIQSYFSESGGKYTIVKEIKNKVAFAYYDLLDKSSANPPDSIFGNFDLVCCNNLLMYYRKDMRMFLVQKLEKSLAPMGILTVGEAEKAFIKSNTCFQSVTIPVPIFQKTNCIR